MKFLITCLFICFKVSLLAQIDSAETFLKRAWEKELELQSGEVNIQKLYYYKDSLIGKSEKTLTFFHEPENTAHHFILDDGPYGVYFSNGENVEFLYRGFRRQWAIPNWSDEFKWRMMNGFEDLSLGFEPERKENRPYMNFLHTKEKYGDSMIHWDPLTRTLSIKKDRFLPPISGRYRVRKYEFNSDSLLFRVTETTVNELTGTTSSEKVVMHYSYSRLNQIPYFHIRQRLKEYQNAPLLSVYRPEKLKIEQYPVPGMAFPDLILMDGIGRTKKLSSLSGPKIMIYPFSPLHSDLAVFSFVDSMENVHPDWNFMIINQNSIDELVEYQQRYPDIHSFHLASVVEGLELNGWPIWFILDGDNKVLAENHGYHVSRNKEFSEWIKEHLTED